MIASSSLLAAFALTALAASPSPSPGLTASNPTAADAGPSLPPVERHRLDNGLEILLMPNAANPYVEVRFVVRAGSAVDPAGKEGLAGLTAAMLTNGTPTRSEEDIARLLEDMGAELGASASLDSLELGGSVVTLDPDNVTTFLDIFQDTLRHASFPQTSLDRTRTLRLAALKRLADSHSGLADRAFRAFLYEGGPRGRVSTTRSVESLTREDLTDYRDLVMIPQHGVLAVAGDFDSASLLAWAQEHLGDAGWGKGACTPGDVPGRCAKLCKAGAGGMATCLENPLARKSYRDRPRAGKSVLLVDRADPSINQIQWRLGTDNPVTVLAPDWPAFRLGTQVLGGDFTARLNALLRVKEGLTYGARFNVDWAGFDAGSMEVSTYVAPKDLDKALRLTLGELARIQTEPIPLPELESFKAKIINAFPFKFETVSSSLGQYLWMAVDRVPVDWLRHYQSAIGAPDAAAVQEALRRVSADSMVLVAVGNADLASTLAQFGSVTVISAADLLESGLAKMAPAAITAAPATDGAAPAATVEVAE